MVDVDRWLSYKGTGHVILLAKLHDMYLYKTATFPHQSSLFKVCLRGGSLTQISLYAFCLSQTGVTDVHSSSSAPTI